MGIAREEVRLMFGLLMKISAKLDLLIAEIRGGDDEEEEDY